MTAPEDSADASVAIGRRGLMLVLSAPSGAGKSSIARRLVEAEPELELSVSATTRAPRPNERDGVDYRFFDAETFDAMIERGELLEWAEIYGNRYGTPRAPVDDALAAGRDVLFDIEWKGAEQLRAAAPGDVASIFLLPPSPEELERRLRAREQDPPEVIARRLEKVAIDASNAPHYDFVLVNDDFERCLAAVRSILAAERARRRRLVGLRAFVARFGSTLD